MKPRTYRLDLTEDELVAVFSECTCCSDPEAHESATGKAYRKLRQIGYFRRAEAQRARELAARKAYQAARVSRFRAILETPIDSDNVIRQMQVAGA